MRKITKATYLNWYEDMLFWRKFEDKLAAVYIQQKVRGFLHLYNGQEAVLAGSLHAIEVGKDRMITGYRNHVQPIGLGVDPKKVMAELYGKVTGTSMGLGGSMHIFSKNHNFFGGHGIVGGQIPLGTGIAFGDKYFGRDNVTLCFLGDGAVRQGSFHESLNLASLWKLPVIYIVENNGYAMGTSVSRTASNEEIWKLGKGYQMPSESVDGMDPVSVANSVSKSVDLARGGGGPSFIEMKTYRYRGHSMSDPAKYRTREEVQKMREEQDPIELIKSKILKEKIMDEDEVSNIDSTIRSEISKLADKAIKANFPTSQDLFNHIYSNKDI